MSNKSPAFQWYPKDHLTDENVLTMTLEEEGAYRRLIDYCWLYGSLPNSVERMARLCRCDSERMATLWGAIEPCFIPDHTDDKRLVHPRLEREKKRQEERRKRQSDAGKAGAKKRWEKTEDGVAMRSPSQTDIGSDSSPSPSSSSSSSKEKTIEKRKRSIPEDWEPNETHHSIAKEEGLDLGRESEKFSNHAGANGRKLINWDQGFCVWLRKANEFNGGSKPAGTVERYQSW